MSEHFALSLDMTALAKVREELAGMSGKELERTLRKAARAAAKTYVVPLRMAAARHTKTSMGTTSMGRPISRGKVGHGFGQPGGLARSIRVSRVRSASGGVSAIVGPFGKEAFTRSWIVRGVRQHPIERRAAERRAIDAWMHRQAGSVAGHRHMLAFVTSGDRIAFAPMVQHRGVRADHFIAAVGLQGRDRAEEAMVKAIIRDASRRRS